MAKPDVEGGSQDTVPTKFPETTPPVGPDLSGWLLTAINRVTETLAKVEAKVESLSTQMDRMEGKVNAIKTEVEGHGKWVHTLKVALAGLGVLIGWAIVYAVGPWVTSKLFPGR